MDAKLQEYDRLILVALEHLDHVRGTNCEKYAENILDHLVCARERYAWFLSLLN